MIPNLITLLNLFLGCIITLLLIEDNLSVNSISYLIIITLFLDFMDGLIARKFNMQTKLGSQLDSLADLISFGLVPGILMYKLFMEVSLDPYLPLLGFFIPMASAYRLANFNLIEGDLKYFIGLPTPANTLFILSLILIISFSDKILIKEIILTNNFLIFITFLSCYLLNSKFKLINLKFKNFKFKGLNKYRIILIITSLTLIIVLGWLSIPLILLLYYVISYFGLTYKKN